MRSSAKPRYEKQKDGKGNNDCCHVEHSGSCPAMASDNRGLNFMQEISTGPYSSVQCVSCDVFMIISLIKDPRLSGLIT